MLLKATTNLFSIHSALSKSHLFKKTPKVFIELAFKNVALKHEFLGENSSVD